MMIMKLSLVVPCYNEEDNAVPFQEAVIKAFADCNYDYEIVFVDDGSKDRTYQKLKEIFLAQKCPTKVIRFTRNFGKEAGLYAGIQHADGDYISLIDADLQQRPEIIKSMVEILDNEPDTDIVAAYQDRRGEGKVLSFFKRGFYRLINRLTDTPLKSDASDFRTFRRCVAESIIDLNEYHRFSKGIFAWVGYNTHYIPYTACQRSKGASKWSFRKLVNYAIDGIIGYSTKPLRMATFLGGLSSVAAFIYLIAIVLEKLIKGIDIPGYATAIVLILFLGGMQLFCIGLIGEYVGRTFEQSKKRPIYIAKELLDHKNSK